MTIRDKVPEVIIIGAGIAGVSVAYELAQRNVRVCVVEMEDHPGYHSTGRSAATFVNCYGNDIIRSISAASKPFFDYPPQGFSDHPLLAKRGALFVAGKDQTGDLDSFISEPRNARFLKSIGVLEALTKVPALRRASVSAAAFEKEAMDIDVNALLMGYLRGLREAGGRLVTGVKIETLRYIEGVWEVKGPGRSFSAPIVVNAAGAWGDQIAHLAGTKAMGLLPKRRTALTIDPQVSHRDWPLTISIDETWYFRPEGGYLLISPADETLCMPCDSQPDELDIAKCINLIERVTNIKIREVVSKRAGLRTFVPDGSPVCGYAEDVKGFFWLVGQGGYGIQTAPALSVIAADLILKQKKQSGPLVQGIMAEDLSPARMID